MQEQVTAVQPNGNDRLDFSVEEADGSTPPERPAAKFVYPGGSKPLEGYTIKRGIGHGGFGEIYYALSDAGKEVALKLVRRNLDVELRGIKHCLNLKHPNLLALYDIRQDDRGDTWVVMEYVSGECLEGVLVAHPNGMPVEQVLAWFHGIAAGVSYLHDRGIVHRDLKPANIFSDEGVVKVGDYGLSKFISCSRRSGQTESVGTVHYMAPEVANGRYGKEIDVYALGIVLYEMLTGRVPFDGESVGEVLMKHLTATPDVSSLAEPYRSVVARALQKDPARRYNSVPEMLAALPEPAHAPPGSGRLPAASGARAGTGTAGTLPPLPEGVVAAKAVDEEPIMRAVRKNYSELRESWDRANLNTPAKVILVVAAVIVLLNAPWLIPLAVMLVIAYAVYRVIRTIVISNHASSPRSGQPGAAATRTPEPPPHTPPARQPAAKPRHDPVPRRTRPGQPVRHHRRRERAIAALVVKPPRERFTELVGSLLAGTLVAVAICVVMVLISSYRDAMPSLQQCAWLAMTSIVGTWAVLVPAKFWEGTKGEAAPRRFIMMVVGLALGALAFSTATMFLVDLPYDRDFGSPHTFQLPNSMYVDGRPLATAYLACFGTLFLLIRWWRQADPLRSSRLSIWSMLVTIVAAGLVAAAWKFPQPWLPMVAGAISVSVQLASPWVPPRERFRRSDGV
ncbi:MAG: hypothetical protein A2V70_03830 [Planctomycetes bacterium RBG_13_63_9]|nr:MAG: hypothetical protein A2V70_03830 [Planctomycetes bacterium RBG_13_63_9]